MGINIPFAQLDKDLPGIAVTNREGKLEFKGFVTDEQIKNGSFCKPKIYRHDMVLIILKPSNDRIYMEFCNTGLYTACWPAEDKGIYSSVQMMPRGSHVARAKKVDANVKKLQDYLSTLENEAKPYNLLRWNCQHFANSIFNLF